MRRTHFAVLLGVDMSDPGEGSAFEPLRAAAQAYSASLVASRTYDRSEAAGVLKKCLLDSYSEYTEGQPRPAPPPTADPLELAFRDAVVRLGAYLSSGIIKHRDVIEVMLLVLTESKSLAASGPAQGDVNTVQTKKLVEPVRTGPPKTRLFCTVIGVRQDSTALSHKNLKPP